MGRRSAWSNGSVPVTSLWRECRGDGTWGFGCSSVGGRALWCLRFARASTGGSRPRRGERTCRGAVGVAHLRCIRFWYRWKEPYRMRFASGRRGSQGSDILGVSRRLVQRTPTLGRVGTTTAFVTYAMVYFAGPSGHHLTGVNRSVVSAQHIRADCPEAGQERRACLATIYMLCKRRCFLARGGYRAI